MKRILLVLAGVLLLVSQAEAISTTTCPGAGCVTLDVAGRGSIGIQITGTWVGTITFKASVDNNNFTAINVIPATSATAVSTTTGNGLWSASVGGLSTVQVVFTAYTSGTAAVAFNTAQARAGSTGTSGGGAGTPAGSNTQIQYNNAGSFGGAAGTVWNNTNDTLNLTTANPPVDSAGTPLNGGFISQVYSNGGSASIQGSAEYDGSTDQSLDSIKGGFFNSGQTGSGKIQTIGVEISTNYSDSTANVPNNYGLHIQSQSGVGTNNYGIFLENQGATNTAIKTGTGLVSFGDTVQAVTYKGAGGNEVDITSGGASGVSNAYNVVLTGGDAAGSGLGGSITLTAGGSNTGTSGDINLTSSDYINLTGAVKVGNGSSLTTVDTPAANWFIKGYNTTSHVDTPLLTVTSNNPPTLTATGIFSTSGATLTVANVGANSCGTTAATIAGNDNAFTITVGATLGTQCRVTFATAATNRRECAANDETTTIAVRSTYVDTTHSDLIGSFTAGDLVSGVCFAR